MTICCKIIIIIILELILMVLYPLITPKEKRLKLVDFNSIAKGIIERVFLTYSLISEFPHALTLFGALKLGTRLKSADNENTEEGKKNESKYNDYYLIGNFISVTLSILYCNLLKD